MEKNIIALLLLLTFALSLLAACGDNNGDTGTSSAADESSEYTSAEVSVDPVAQWKDADGRWAPKQSVQAVKDLIAQSDKNTFNICVRGASVGTYQSDDFSTGDDTSGLYGDTLTDAVKTRNDTIAEKYGVDLIVDKNDNFMNAIRNDIESSTGTYDAIMPALKELAVLAAEGKLYELSDIEGFDINAPWYDENATKAFSIKNQVYFTTGDITILNKVCAPSVLFNKDMIESYKLESPYQLVKDKQWTFDKLIEMGRAVADTSRDDVFENIYGMLTEYNNTADFYGAANELITIKNADDIPVLSIGTTERSTTLLQKILETYAEGENEWLIYGQDARFGGFSKSLAVFGDGHALFRPSGFSACAKLRQNYEVNFGILPYPLMDSTQEDYVSYCGSSNDVAGIGIPITAKNPVLSAYIIDAYSAEAKNVITHAYYDVILYKKEAYDQESEEMLDIIFGNIVYDMGEAFDFGGIGTVIYELTKSRSTNVVSALDAVYEAARNEIDELVSYYN